MRLWDVGHATEDTRSGRVVVQVDHDIAYISLGDPFNGEHRLVVYVAILVGVALY